MFFRRVKYKGYNETPTKGIDMSPERIIITALAGAVTVATAIIIVQEEHIQELEAEVAKQKRITKIWKRATLKFHKTADAATLKEVNSMLGHEIAFENIINNF